MRIIQVLSLKLIIFLVLLFNFSGCTTTSNIPFSPAPKPPSGSGLVYIMNEGNPSALNNISSVYFEFLDSEGKVSRIFTYLVAGEYTWLHLKAGRYKAAYAYPANGQVISVPINIESGETNYVELSSTSPYFVSINQVAPEISSKKILSFKYWEYKNKDCTLVVKCR